MPKHKYIPNTELTNEQIEKRRKYQRDYYAKNSEKLKEHQREYYAKHPSYREMMKESNRRYLSKHPEAKQRNNEYNKRRYAEDPDYRNRIRELHRGMWYERQDMKKNETICASIIANFERLSPNYQTLISNRIRSLVNKKEMEENYANNIKRQDKKHSRKI
jgi:hypothetical protein